MNILAVILLLIILVTSKQFFQFLNFIVKLQNNRTTMSGKNNESIAANSSASGDVPATKLSDEEHILLLKESLDRLIRKSQVDRLIAISDVIKATHPDYNVGAVIYEAFAAAAANRQPQFDVAGRSRGEHL